MTYLFYLFGLFFTVFFLGGGGRRAFVVFRWKRAEQITIGWGLPDPWMCPGQDQSCKPQPVFSTPPQVFDIKGYL